MSNFIHAPFTDEQVEALNLWQQGRGVHPFTCGTDHGQEVVLYPTSDGWVCPKGCGYTQDWAHGFMADFKAIAEIGKVCDLWERSGAAWDTPEDKDWYTVGFIGVPTDDGRIINGPVTTRESPLPVMMYDPDKGWSGNECVGSTEVRIEGNEIQALLAPEHKGANLDLSVKGRYETCGGATVIGAAEVIGVTIAGPSAWAELGLQDEV